MPYYRVYILDRANHIKDAQVYNYPNDLAALAQGERLCGDNEVEIWEGSRIIARVKTSNAPLTDNDPKSI